eukprot:667687-Prymnesium_polylepis.3
MARFEGEPPARIKAFVKGKPGPALEGSATASGQCRMRKLLSVVGSRSSRRAGVQVSRQSGCCWRLRSSCVEVLLKSMPPLYRLPMFTLALLSTYTSGFRV